MKIAIGADDAGVGLKDSLQAYLRDKGYDCVDFGVHGDEKVIYPDIALKVATSVQSGECVSGMLICGTGIGMCIVANKIPGIRAACCHDAYSAERARKSNNAQIITMGARVIGEELAKTILNVWLDSDFEGGRSLPKVKRIEEIDCEYRKKQL